MLNITSGLRRRRLADLSPVTFGVGVLVFLLAVLGVGARGRFNKTIEVERLNLRPSGFQPAAITRPKGRFLLVVNNLTGKDDDLTLRLDREAGGALIRAQAPRDKRRWRDLVDLPPGGYLLTEANHPEWVCRITITAQ